MIYTAMPSRSSLDPGQPWLTKHPSLGMPKSCRAVRMSMQHHRSSTINHQSPTASEVCRNESRELMLLPPRCRPAQPHSDSIRVAHISNHVNKSYDERRLLRCNAMPCDAMPRNSLTWTCPIV